MLVLHVSYTVINSVPLVTNKEFLILNLILILYHIIIFLLDYYLSFWHKQQKIRIGCPFHLLITVTASTIFHLTFLLRKTQHKLKQMKAPPLDHFAPQLYKNYINYTDIERNYVTLSGKDGRGKVKCTRALPACGASDNFLGCEDREQ